MQLKALLSAAALSAAMCSVSLADISGKVTLQGTPPDAAEIKGIAAVPQCKELHKDPVYDDSIIVGDKGELANVIVFIKPADGQKLEGPAADRSRHAGSKRVHVFSARPGSRDRPAGFRQEQ